MWGRSRFRPVVAGVLLVLVVQATPVPATDTEAIPQQDALANRTLQGLRSYVRWLQANNAKGYIGEVGWPGDQDRYGARWNQLAERWYDQADAAGLWVTAWATGEWWGTTYPLTPYQASNSDTGVDTARSQARVLEAHPTRSGRLRGVNVAGAEFAAPNVDPVSSFSNANPGVYQRAYHYDSQATFDYLASRGVKLVRIPFRWERLTPRLGRLLKPTEIARLKAAVNRAHRAGLLVVLDMHNYGAYYLSDGDRGVRRPLGSSPVPVSAFADVWRRLSIHFRKHPAVIGYGLMNEPVDMVAAGRTPPAVVWERASQAAVRAIRANGDRKWVMVSSYPWGGVWQFAASHPRAWIRDPARRVRYEAHQYFDHDNSGRYHLSYDEQIALVSASE